MASPLEPLAVRGRRRVWYIGCHSPSDSGGCADEDIAAIELSGSTDVFVRSATDAERQQPQYASLIAFVVGGDDDEPVAVAPAVARVDVDADSGLRTLFLGSFSRASDVEIVLLRHNTIQEVSVKGSGVLTVGDHVLAASGSVAISTAGSADVFANCTDAMDLTRLDIKTAGSADVQISLGHVQAADVMVTAGSGDIALFTESIGVSASAVVSSTGSGDLCWSTSEEMNIAGLQVAGLSSADITITSTSASSSSCGKLDIQSVGSGIIDLGGVRCKTALVSLFGSSDVVVQASDSITGEALGSGSVRYTGAAPNSIGWSYSSLLAEPVKSSYHVPTCKPRSVHQYGGDDNVLLSGPVGAGAATAQGGGVGTQPSSAPASVEQPPPSSSPLSSPGSEVRHLNALLLLGVVALIAALALWRFNRSRSGRRQQRWDHFEAGGGFDHAASSSAEKQPLVSKHRPVYI